MVVPPWCVRMRLAAVAARPRAHTSASSASVAGVAYVAKFCWLGESVRDYADIFLQMSYMPKGILIDCACGVCKHLCLNSAGIR